MQAALHEHPPRQKLFKKLAGRIELYNWWFAAVENPEVSMGIRLHGDNLSPLDAGRELCPVLDRMIGIGQAVEWRKRQ